ncbi:MAG: FCD domain-containing protein, partial [Pseudomonadota bacterium]
EAFHRGLLALSGNRHLAETGIRFREKIGRGRFVASRLLPQHRREQSTERHGELVALLASDRPEDAVTAHTARRASGEREILATIDRAKLQNL